MKWKNIKFWCWIEVGFPPELVVSRSSPAELYDDLPPEIFGAGPQGPQATNCDEEATTAVCFDLLSFQSEFELNGIPSAVVNVALGRRADDVTKASKIHTYIDSFQLQLPATVWCVARTLTGSFAVVTDEWPTDKFPVFIGNVAGSGFNRNSQGATFTLTLSHWLSALNFSSCISGQTHPLNPAQFFFPATHVLNTEFADGSFIESGPMMIGGQLASGFFDYITVIDDFWGGTNSIRDDGLKKMLLYFTKEDRINAEQIRILTGSEVDQAAINKEACRALLRFEPGAKSNDFVDAPGTYILGVPLAMADNTDIATLLGNSIANGIGLGLLQLETNVTMWDKLAGDFRVDFLYSIVPLVEKALIVPFIAGLSSGDSDNTTLVHRIIRTSQYDSLDINIQIPRPLRAVGILMGLWDDAGGSNTKDRTVPYQGFGGYFDKWAAACSADGGAPADCDERFKTGLIMFKQSPRWLSGFVSSAFYAGRSTGINSADGISTVTAPGAGGAHADATPDSILINAIPTWNIYARSLYINEVLKNRQGMLSGPVRFDIAPGSQIMIEAAEDKYVRALLHPVTEEDDCIQNSSWYWASVLRVSTVIDCQNARAFTSFYLAHIRTEEENLDAGTSINKHPLWPTYKWAGCVMVEDDIFAPLVTKTGP